MKRTLLLSLLLSAFTSLNAQKSTAYAITAAEKGHAAWGEVRLIDVISGQELKSIFSSKDQAELLNARTGKPVVKKDIKPEQPFNREFIIRYKGSDDKVLVKPVDGQAKSLSGIVEKRMATYRTPVQMDQPFSTSSAACAYDKKHDRLYYTPLGIAQLRYIDLKAKTPTIHYFEDEAFGVLTSPRDVPNQITRMVIAGRGEGFALTNNANHLIKFSTNKKGVITDLGALTDDAANGNFSIHSNGGYGGDMIAGERGNLYLITANRNVFKIDPDTKVATYLGAIKGLPKGFSTNGAVVEKGTFVIVSSANSTQGYFRFDMNTLESEKVSAEGEVFNASDLAGSALLAEKKKDDKVSEVKPEDAIAQTDKSRLTELLQKNSLSVYPNPVATGSMVRLSFGDQPKGKYAIQFLDISGKMISSKEVTINSKMQVQDYKVPELLSRGNYLIKVVNDQNKLIGINTIIVQ